MKIRIWPFNFIAVKWSPIWLQSEVSVCTVQCCQPSCPWRGFSIDVYHCGHSHTQWITPLQKPMSHTATESSVKLTETSNVSMWTMFFPILSFTTTIEAQFKQMFWTHDLQHTENSCSSVYVCFKVFNVEISLSEVGLKSMDICLSW